LGAHRITDFNFLAQSVGYEAHLDWREAGAGAKSATHTNAAKGGQY